MKFPLAALSFLAGSFILFVFYVVSSVIVGETHDALLPIATAQNLNASGINLMNLLPEVLGILCAIFFVTGLLLFFVLESLSDDDEYYYR